MAEPTKAAIPGSSPQQLRMDRSRSRPSAWSSSCWCRCPAFRSISCWPPALPLRSSSCSPRCKSCVRCSFPSSPACCFCSPCSACRSTSPPAAASCSTATKAPPPPDSVIEAFGQFVVGGNYVVGFVLFIALIAIQYIVVSHGAVRTAEVTARFTLDAMPGKQMAIDADLNAGLIDEHQARARREQMAREAEFYGAMDGAARFSQRDSMATILHHRHQHRRRLSHRSLPARHSLSRGAQDLHRAHRRRRPGHHDSLAAGLHRRRHGRHPRLLQHNPLRRSRPATLRPPPFSAIAGGAMFAMASSPACPNFPSSSWSPCCGLAGMAPAQTRQGQRRQGHQPPVRPGAAAAAKKTGKPSKSDSLEDLLKLDELSLEVGYALVALVDAQQGGKLLPASKRCASILASATRLHRSAASISPTTSASSRANTSSLCAASKSPAGRCSKTAVLAISSEPEPPRLAGIATREPAFGVAALWIAPALREQAIDCRLCGRRSDFGARHPPLRTHPPARLRIADPAGNQAPARSPQREPPQAGRRTGAQDPDPRRSAKSLAATSARAGFRPRPRHHPRDPAGRGRHQQEPVLLVEAARQALGRALVRPLLSERRRLRVLTLDPTSKRNSATPSARRRRPPPAPALQPSFIRRILEACGSWPEIRWRRPRPSCSAPPRALSSAPLARTLSPQSGSAFSRWKFLPWFPCSRWVRCDENGAPAIRVSRWSISRHSRSAYGMRTISRTERLTTSD